MSLKSDLLRALLGTKPVTVKGLLTQDDMLELINRFRDELHASESMIMIWCTNTGDIRFGVSGDCQADDLTAIRMLWDTLDQVTFPKNGRKVKNDN